jgi:hypothetical protein
MAMVDATLTIEYAFVVRGDGIESVPIVRVIPHDEEGKKPRGKKGQGIAIVANKGESHSDVLRTIAEYFDQEGADWSAFLKERLRDA